MRRIATCLCAGAMMAVPAGQVPAQNTLGQILMPGQDQQPVQGGDAQAGGLNGGMAAGQAQQPDGQTGFGPLPKAGGLTPPPQPQPAANPELQDFGVAPTPNLFAGPPHAPTPNSIPGGQVITTVGVQALVDGQAGPFLMLDILGGQTGLPNAVRAVPASQGGTFQDQIQGQFGQFLEQATQGRKDMPIVLYCLSPECWMSYNASLRAINLGYQNVLWYRGGLEAWQGNGKQLTPLQ